MRGVTLLAAVVPLFFGSIGALGADGPLRIGLTGKYPPFNYFQTDGKLTGFDVEVAHELCRRIERRCEFRILPWDSILSALLSKRIDLIVASMAITEERAKQVRFTTPYYESGAQLFVRKEGPKPESPGFRIGVTLGTTYGDYARQYFSSAEIRTYKGDVEIFTEIRQGRLDGMVTDRLVGAYLIQTHNAPLRADGELLYKEQIGIPVRKEDLALHSQLNQAVMDLRASPRYQELYQKYFSMTANTRLENDLNWIEIGRLLGRAWLKTVEVSVYGLGLGLVVSALLAFLMIRAYRPVATVLRFAVDFVRATPFMIQLFALYFGLPAIGIQLPAFGAAILAITLHSAAYLAEIFKNAYSAVPIGQSQAARTLGLSGTQTLRHVIWPQMLPILTVPTLNTIVAMIKDSAIVSVISVHELTLQAQELISSTFRPLEFYAIAAGLYFVLTYPLLLTGRSLEKKYTRKGLLRG